MFSGEQSNPGVDSWDERYRLYQGALTSRFLIPTLTEWSIPLEGKRVLEVGCGDGGCAAEFFRAGCRVTAVDIDERLVGIANAFNRKEGLGITARVGDICRKDCPGLEDGPFDLVVLRDVVEHLENLVTALDIISAHLAENGAIFVVFPPYYSPYGAHQQILPKKKIPYNKLPYIHLLPNRLFVALTSGPGAPNREVTRLRGIRLTIRKFERQLHGAGLRVRHRKFYLSRPTFKLRYGMPVVGAGVLGRIPLLRELVTTACYYLLEKRN